MSKQKESKIIEKDFKNKMKMYDDQQFFNDIEL